MGQVLSIKFLSLKVSGLGAALALSLCVELRVTGGKFGIRRRICVIISPATLATLVGHLRGEEKNILKTPRAISWRDWTGNFRQDLQNYQDSEDIGADPFAWQMGKAKMPS